MTRKFLIATMALVGLAVGTLACPVSASADEKVRFLLPTVKELPSFAPWVLAKYEGYYAAEGLDVEFLVGKGGVDAAKQVGADNADMSEGIGDTAIIVRPNGVPVTTVAVLGGGGLTQLVVRKQSGIKSIKDLRGKTVVVVSYQDSTFYSLLGMLASVGLTRNDLKIEAVGPVGIIQAITSGSADAAACIPDWVVKIQDAGVPIDVYPSAEYVPSMAQAIIASEKTLKEHPDMVRKLIKGTLRAFLELRDHPVETAKVYVKALPVHQGEEEYLGRVFSAYAKFVYGGDQKKPGMMDPAKFEKLQDLYISENIIRSKVPVKELFTNDYLPK